MRSMQDHGRFVVMIAVLALAALPLARADFETGMSYFQSGKYLEAAGQFQALVDENPEYADGYHLLGICFLQTGKYADAEKNFVKAIELNGDKFEFHFNLAKTYQAQKKYAKLVSTLNNAEGLAAEGQKYHVYHARGNALAAQKKWAEAIDDLEKALAIKPDAATQTQLGKAYYTLGDTQAAVTALRKAVELGAGQDAYSLMLEGMIDLAAKASGSRAKAAYAEALTEAEKFLAANPSSIDAKYLVGRAALGSGQFDKAIRSFQAVLKSRPDNCRAMTNMGTAYQGKADWANALSSLEKATSCDPKMNLAWQTKGFVLQKTASESKDPTVKQEKYRQAIASYKKALAIKPSPRIEQSIQDCEHNIQIAKDNLSMEAEEREAQRLIEEEKRRVEEEEAKIRAWQEKQEGD